MRFIAPPTHPDGNTTPAPMGRGRKASPMPPGNTATAHPGTRVIQTNSNHFKPKNASLSPSGNRQPAANRPTIPRSTAQYQLLHLANPTSSGLIRVNPAIENDYDPSTSSATPSVHFAGCLGSPFTVRQFPTLFLDPSKSNLIQPNPSGSKGAIRSINDQTAQPANRVNSTRFE